MGDKINVGNVSNSKGTAIGDGAHVEINETTYVVRNNLAAIEAKLSP